MSSLSSLRPSLARGFCKKQLDAYLSSTIRSAHSLISVPTPSSRRPPHKKFRNHAETAKPPNVPSKSPYYGKLKPYELSKRLSALTEKGEVDAAVTMLKNMPLAAQNVSVWNTVIKAAFDAGKLKLAYSLYTDMKRRGFRPNMRSYTTMISGYHRVRSWDAFENQLGNVHSVYRSFTSYIEDVTDSVDSGNTPQAIRAAMTQYLDICYNARQSKELEEAFERLPVRGPLSRDARMYAPYLRDLLRRDLPPAEVAAAVRQVWKEVQEIWVDGSAGEPKTYGFLADLIFKGLTESPSVADHSLAFEIVRDVFELHPAGNTSKSTIKGSVMPPWTVAPILNKAILLGRPEFVLDFAKLVPWREDLQSALNMSVVHQVLSATREINRRDNAKVLNALVQVIAAQCPQQLDKASLTVQGILKACVDCNDFVAAKGVIGAVLRVRPNELASARYLQHTKVITTTSWSYFAHSALHGNTADAKLAITVLEKQARHVIEDVASGQPLKNTFMVSLAQALAQLVERAGEGFGTTWYNELRTSIDAYLSAPRDGLLSDDPFAPGVPGNVASELDALELTEDVTVDEFKSPTGITAEAAASTQ